MGVAVMATPCTSTSTLAIDFITVVTIALAVTGAAVVAAVVLLVIVTGADDSTRLRARHVPSTQQQRATPAIEAVIVATQMRVATLLPTLGPCRLGKGMM